MISTCPDQQQDDQQHHQDGSGWCRNHTRIETPGICHQSLITAPRIDDLGLGELPVDSAQDRALAGLLCAGNGARPKPGESDRWRDASPIVRGLSGDCQDVVRGSIWCAGACAVISGVIVSPAGISGAAIGCVNSFPFVRSFVRSLVLVLVVVDATICAADMVRRYAQPICIDDMVNRYARPENRKGQEHVAPGP